MKTVPLSTKTRPMQARSHETFELIVKKAGKLLEEIGFEQLTTNLVCAEAGITPPALYRYFPNKYAILKELGDRLMAAQDDAVFDWLERGVSIEGTFEERVAKSVEVQRKVIEVTRAFPGNIAITRALRAVPMLHAVRIASRDRVAQRQAVVLARAYPNVPIATLEVCSRLCVELSYAAMEMVLEEPERDSDLIIEGVCQAAVLYLDNMQRQYG